MLRLLSIRNYVIAEAVDFEPSTGFVVLTGETGAGKSMLVDAIELLVGGRADAAQVRAGSDRAELSAEFELSPGGRLHDWLQASDLAEPGDTVLLRRTVDRSGRSRAYVNGRQVTLAQLREAGEFLVDIHGQHAHQSLLRPVAQRALLDGFSDATDIAQECAAAHREWRRCAKAVADAEAAAQTRESEQEALRDQCLELRGLRLVDGEWTALEETHRRLAHGASLKAGAEEAVERLGDADGGCAGVLGVVAKRLEALGVHDARLTPIIEMVDGAQAQAQEALRLLRAYVERVELDPAALRSIEARIEVLHAAGRRFRVPPAQLGDLLQRTESRLADLDRSADVAGLRRAQDEAWRRLDGLAGELSRKRTAGAARLSKAVTQTMQRMAITGGRFQVALHRLGAPGAQGAEDIDFEVSAHKSLPLRPLARVASGGELSRISLALQMVTVALSPVGTLVFDEVDAGIGGAVAESVGRALNQLGRARQVLCVTHLPQVAAQGDTQWSVRRVPEGGSVRAEVALLDRAGRVEELARMLGGAEITGTTRRHALELLER